jgi:hypothetical protein
VLSARLEEEASGDYGGEGEGGEEVGEECY